MAAISPLARIAFLIIGFLAGGKAAGGCARIARDRRSGHHLLHQVKECVAAAEETSYVSLFGLTRCGTPLHSMARSQPCCCVWAMGVQSSGAWAGSPALSGDDGDEAQKAGHGKHGGGPESGSGVWNQGSGFSMRSADPAAPIATADLTCRHCHRAPTKPRANRAEPCACSIARHRGNTWVGALYSLSRRP